MISKEQFLEMHELRQQGVTITRIAEKYQFNTKTISRWLNMTEEEFDTQRRSKMSELEQYRGYILDLIKTCPQIRETNILFRLQEAFPEFECKRSVFYKYMKKLREQTGLEQFSQRQTGLREEQPPGYEAQVDFGQFKMKDMYGMNVRVYFFCMVLSYSRMHFVYFTREPFNTTTAIKAHEYAFRFFGGRTQTIMYDLDKVFVVSENLGNIIFVPEFEEYVKRTGYSVVLCRPRDPQTKGRVENFVKYVKAQFLDGRIYTGIDSLNSAALEWLDLSANVNINGRTRKEPREMFREESRCMQKVSQSKQKDSISTVNTKNCVLYKNALYEFPRIKAKPGDIIRIEADDGHVMFYRTDDGTLVRKCAASTDGTIVLCEQDKESPETVSSVLFEKTFSHYACYDEFMEGFQKVPPRYRNLHISRICMLAKAYTEKKVVKAMEYCVKTERCNAIYLVAYLMAKYGSDKARKVLPCATFGYCQKRALEIVREQGWQT